ncbi:MAG: glycosyltransferase family 2 protein [Actinobacteria bacterium]|nr:glycosyltransferase family 2 protein [Actinomycetota bacterium]
MKRNPKIYIVVPAYNEERYIADVIIDLKEHGYNNIIVIDDGSTDGTVRTAKKNKAIVLSHPINLGQGSAIQTGLEYAVTSGADMIITFDSDGQHMACDIKSLVEPLINGKAEVTLGSRFLNNNSNTPWVKKIMLKGGTLLLFMMYGIMLTDTHNGLRAFTADAASKMQLESRGMEHASEIIEKIKLEKIRYIEVPVTIRYTDYSIKKGQKLSNSLNILFKMLAKWFIR